MLLFLSGRLVFPPKSENKKFLNRRDSRENLFTWKVSHDGQQVPDPCRRVKCIEGWPVVVRRQSIAPSSRGAIVSVQEKKPVSADYSPSAFEVTVRKGVKTAKGWIGRDRHQAELYIDFPTLCTDHSSLGGLNYEINSDSRGSFLPPLPRNLFSFINDRITTTTTTTMLRTDGRMEEI